MTTRYGWPLILDYDEENRLVSAGSVSYTYDLLGRRLSRTYNSVTTAYVWDGAHIIAEYENSSLARKYVYGPGMDNPVAMIDCTGAGEVWYYYYADAQGSVRLLTDAGGSIVESYAYWTYGYPVVMIAAGDGNWLTDDPSAGASISSSYGNPYMFTARRWDSTTRLYYYRFRDYAPKLGRFLQTDPAGYIDTMNLYAYCGNNPVNWIDPLGLKGYDTNEQEEGPDEPSLLERLRNQFRSQRRQELIDEFSPEEETTIYTGWTPPVIDAIGGTYILRDPITGVVKRTGRTNNHQRRRGEHARHPETKKLDYEVDRYTDDYAKQRGREQVLYDKYPEAKEENGGLNRKRLIWKYNPNLKRYLEAAKELE